MPRRRCRLRKTLSFLRLILGTKTAYSNSNNNRKTKKANPGEGGESDFQRFPQKNHKAYKETGMYGPFKGKK